MARKDDPLAEDKRRYRLWVAAENLLNKGFVVSMDASGKMKATCLCGKSFFDRFAYAEQHYDKCPTILRKIAAAPASTSAADYRERMAMLPKPGDSLNWTTTDPVTGKAITMRIRIEDVEAGRKH